MDPKEQAIELLSQAGIDGDPVDVEAVAQYLDISVLKHPLEDVVSGVLVLKNARAAIGVNENHHRHRQRFTIAHELGHFVLHRGASSVFVDGSLTFYRDQDSAEGINTQEIEANTFAAELLMPEKSLREYLARFGSDALDEVVIRSLASIFDVSEQAVTFRLVNLGLVTQPA